MSDTGASEAARTPKVGWFTWLFWRLAFVVIAFVFLGNAVLIADFLADKFSKLNIPYVSALVSPHRVPSPATSGPEFGYVLEAFDDGSPIAFRENQLYLLRRKIAFQGVTSPASVGIVVNILSMNRDGNENHWVFKGDLRAILETKPIYAPADDPRSSVLYPAPVGIAMVVAEQDTNRNGWVGAGDKVSLYVYRFNGKPPEKVLTADNIVVDRSGAANRSRVFYQNASTTFVATYAMPGFELVNKAPIKDMPKMAAQAAPEYPEEDD